MAEIKIVKGVEEEIDARNRLQVGKNIYMGGGVVIRNPEGKILMGLRSNKDGNGLWCIPGGYMDKSDDGIKKAVFREAKEEAGLEHLTYNGLISIDDSQLNDNGRRHMNFGVLATTTEEPKVSKPDEISEWRWFGIDEIPESSQIYPPSRITIESYISKKLQVNQKLKTE